MKTVRMLAPLVLGLLLFAAACGGDDDDAPASTSGGSSSGSAAPAATAEDDAAPTPESSAGGGGDNAGSVTIGGETWNIVASVECTANTADNLPVFRIEGHAEGDETTEIIIEFDPRDLGLVMSVVGTDGDPVWTSIGDTFTTQAGGTSISGTGTFSNAPVSADTAEGSFEAAC